jgi:ABC-type multidrug transport system fused ATPase/permease subunit
MAPVSPLPDEKTRVVKTAAGYFALVLIGSLVAAILGGGFGSLVAYVSPEFVKSLFSLKPGDGSVVRYAFSTGMIWGLFIGVAVSCFACLLTTIISICRLRVEHRPQERG